MFETVAPEQFGKRDRTPLYEAVPFSIAVHSLAVAAAVIGNVWSVSFPPHSPAQVAIFSLAETPPPPPPPPPPPKPSAQPPEVPIKPMAIPQEIVAPVMIPEQIPKIEPRTVVAAAPDVTAEGVEGGIEGGQAGGVVGGEVGGVLGGVVGGLMKDQVRVSRDKPLPMFPLSQVYPTYPEQARLNAWEDQLVVRYIIGKDGRVKEVMVIAPPYREIFVEATVRAIRSWRFRPLVKDGQRQEVIHELTVLYRLVQG